MAGQNSKTINIASLPKSLLSAASNSNYSVVLLLVIIVAMMILPMPTMVIDFMLAVSLMISIIILLYNVYIEHPLKFSTFPSLLLLITLFRLSLSISSTRLILTNADAGSIIRTFGEFVISGSIIVGLVIFLIITVVQFVVITKGAERIAEVAARFTLDSMPGKQMSIDGDVRSGNIEKDVASHQRMTLQRESKFYGSMDGAMKFIKGDAIAGILIIFVNLIGGFLVGIISNGMSFSEALAVYSILTIGDGLVTQIPALIIAISAGIIVSRIEDIDGSDLNSQITSQIFSNDKVLLIGGIIAFCVGLVPGFPFFVFAIIGGGMFIFGVNLHKTLYLTAEHSPGIDTLEPDIKSEDESDIQGGVAQDVHFEKSQHQSDPFVIVFDESLNGHKMQALEEIIFQKIVLLAEFFGFPALMPTVSTAQIGQEYISIRMNGIQSATIKVTNDVNFANQVQSILFSNAHQLFAYNTVNEWLEQSKFVDTSLVEDVRKNVALSKIVAICRIQLANGIPITSINPMLEIMLALKDKNPMEIADAIRYGNVGIAVQHLIATEGSIQGFSLSDALRKRFADKKEPEFTISEINSLIDQLLSKKREGSLLVPPILVDESNRRAFSRVIRSQNIFVSILTKRDIPIGQKFEFVGKLEV